MAKHKRNKHQGGSKAPSAPIQMSEIVAPPIDDPLIPMDSRQAETAVDYVVLGKGKQKPRHFVETCRLIGSVTNGILTVSVPKQKVILSLRLEDVMSFVVAVTEAAHAEEEAPPAPDESV